MRNKIHTTPSHTTLLMGEKKYLLSICHVLLLLLLTLNSPPGGMVVAHDYAREEAAVAQSCWSSGEWKVFRMPHEQSALLLSCCSSLELCSDRPMAFQRQGARGQGALCEPFFSWDASSNARHREEREWERDRETPECLCLPPSPCPAQSCAALLIAISSL